MENSDLKKYFQDIKVFHIAVGRLTLPIDTFSKYFLEYKTLEFYSEDLPTKLSDLLIVEIEKLTKENFKILNDLVKKNSTKEIIIFAEDNENAFLLKFALHFSINKIYPLKIDEKELVSVLKGVTKKILLKKEEKNQIEISKKINSLFALLIFKSDKLIFANEKAKEIFEQNEILDIENIIRNDEQLYGLLLNNQKEKIDVIMQNSNGENWNYEFFLETFNTNEDKLITIIPQEKVETTEAFLTTISRFKFIEYLKDRLAQNSVQSIPMAIIGINISNYQKLLDVYGSIIMHNFIKKFIDRLCHYKDTCQDLSQWNPHFFLFLIEGESFEKVKLELDSIHQKLIYSDIDGSISPIITSTTLSINKLEINDIIDALEHISSHSYSKNDFNSCDFFEINYFNDYIDENEQIHHYLRTCIGSQTPIKLLNIYKGLCINTVSKIIKAKDDTYFVHCESLQGYSMQFENKTVIQAPDLPKDLEADVIYVNIEKSYAVVNNLNFLETSANNRQNTRVQPNIRTPITIIYGKNSFHGNILDISTQAIAIILNHSLSDELKNKQIELRFKLPDESKENGFAMMDIEGIVMFVREVGMTKTKVVVNMQLDKPYDSYLLKYMYDRQKELILELKRAVKVHNIKKRA